jgi:hypothetical protein
MQLPQSLLASNSLLWRPRSRDSAQRHLPKAWCKIVFGSQLASARRLLSDFPIVAVPAIMIGCSPVLNVTEGCRSLCQIGAERHQGVRSSKTWLDVLDRMAVRDRARFPAGTTSGTRFDQSHLIRLPAEILRGRLLHLPGKISCCAC